jgi:hypothetical protein
MLAENTLRPYFLISNMTNAQTCEVGIALAQFNVQSWNHVQQHEETSVANITQFNFPHKEVKQSNAGPNIGAISLDLRVPRSFLS